MLLPDVIDIFRFHYPHYAISRLITPPLMPLRHAAISLLSLIIVAFMLSLIAAVSIFSLLLALMMLPPIF